MLIRDSLGLVYVGAARSFDQTSLRPSVIKRIRQIDVKYITHMQSVLAKWKCINKKRRPCKKKGIRKVKKMRDRSAQKDIY